MSCFFHMGVKMYKENIVYILKLYIAFCPINEYKYVYFCFVLSKFRDKLRVRHKDIGGDIGGYRQEKYDNFIGDRNVDR